MIPRKRPTKKVTAPNYTPLHNIEAHVRATESGQPRTKRLSTPQRRLHARKLRRNLTLAANPIQRLLTKHRRSLKPAAPLQLNNIHQPPHQGPARGLFRNRPATITQVGVTHATEVNHHKPPSPR